MKHENTIFVLQAAGMLLATAGVATFLHGLMFETDGNKSAIYLFLGVMALAGGGLLSILSFVMKLKKQIKSEIKFWEKDFSEGKQPSFPPSSSSQIRTETRFPTVMTTARS